ncbi:MAG: NAD(P)H-hydrate epimerase, partial [Pedobacter sp.]
MLKLLNAEQTKQADKHTIENEPITSIELMERASSAFVKFFVERFPVKNLRISVYCGKGNNGGDGLAIARLLVHERYTAVNVFIADFTENQTSDFSRNLELLQELDISIFYLKLAADLEFQQSDIVVDALFGIGLNRALDGEWSKLIKRMNQLSGTKLSVDVPSGMPSEGVLIGDAIFKSDLTITFQRPKLNFLLPASNPYIKEWKVVNIGLDENFIESTGSPYYWFWKKDVQSYLRPRQAFDHKGVFGHALLFAGADETMGAALLSADACHKTGCGLTSVSIPTSGLTALNSRMPEVM